jgi:outer membrane receptor protein involved in Fe transport
LGWLAVAAAVLLSPRAVSAQPQSAIVRGLVAGADGQPVAGAVVTLLDPLGSRVAATGTDANGRFRLEDVAPGTYTLMAEAPPQHADARVVTVQAALPLDVELTLAARIAENVIVRHVGDAPPATTRVTFAGEALGQVPARLSSRGVQHLLATLPGWAGEDNGLLHVRGVDDGILYVEDGVPVYDRLDTLFGIAPDPAGVGSLNVLTGYVPPEYGLKSGAVIEVQSSAAPRAAWTATVHSGVGGDRLRALGAVGGGPIGSRMSLGASVATERSDRFLDPVHPDNFHNEGGVVSGQAHLTLLASAADLVKINAAGGRSRHQVPHGARQEAAGQDERQRLRQDAQSVSWQRFWSDAMVSRLAVYRRRVDADLRPSPADTPLAVSSDRRHDRLGVLAGATVNRGRHTAKAGLEAARLVLREDFGFVVTDSVEADAAGISRRAATFALDHPFRFRDRASRRQWAFYAQDSVRATDRVTVDVGLRVDRTRLLARASQWSPRVGVAYSWPAAATTMRASVNRFFQPPQPEHLLLASSAAARALSPFAGSDQADGAGGADLEPERQTAWEVGIERRFAGAARLDASFWLRHVRNYADPNVLFGTTIIFPNSIASGTARGVDLRLELAKHRGWSSYVSYTLSRIEQVGPVNGGLFLEESVLDIGPGTRFTPDHDQRHVGAAGLSYETAGRGFSASLSLRYGSGTPLDVEDEDLADLEARPGAELVDFGAGRTRPHAVVDVMVSRTLHRGRPADASVSASVVNLTNHRYALNFGNPFSGTHFGAPRTFRVDLRIGLR